MDVSIFCSAVRPAMWDSCLSSFLSTSVSFEVIFGGFCTEEEVKPFIEKYPFFRYIHTKNVKPSQVYEITRRECTGTTVIWFADDAEVVNDVIGKAYRHWHDSWNEKLILSLQTKESGYNMPVGQLFDMNVHRFFAGDQSSPLMAPIGMMSRKFLEEIGGFDRRFICGQYENFLVMQAYERGATVEIFGGPDCYINIDHLGKSIAIGESKTEADFLNRPFAKGYPHDRAILEKYWTIFNRNKLLTILQSGKRAVHQSEFMEVSKILVKEDGDFEPYVDDGTLLIKSQGPSLHWD